MNNVKKLFRSSTNKVFFGVCGGIGEYLNLDPTVIRVLYVVACFLSLGAALLAYLIFALVIPQDFV